MTREELTAHIKQAAESMCQVFTTKEVKDALLGVARQTTPEAGKIFVSSASFMNLLTDTVMQVCKKVDDTEAGLGHYPVVCLDHKVDRVYHSDHSGLVSVVNTDATLQKAMQQGPGLVQLRISKPVPGSANITDYTFVTILENRPK